MNRYMRFFVAGVFGLLVFVSAANAETHITNGYLYSNAIWPASGSPYIIEDTVTIPAGISLVVEPGTSVIGTEAVADYPVFYVKGDLTMLGTSDKRISVRGFGSISTSDGTTSISNADIALRGGLNLLGGSAVISSSTISSSTNGIYSKLADVLITDSRIYGNTYGIYVKKPGPPVYQERSAGAAVAATDASATVSAIHSSIVDNAEASIYNETDDPVYAVNDWWGRKEGPLLLGANKVVGSVQYEPWLMEDPDARDICCSSVLFLPGLEASRLYDGTEKLWEPLSYDHVRSLYLDANGSSTNPAVYSNDLVDIALYTKGIYYKFIQYMNSLVVGGTINQWKPFAYDWREPIDRVVTGSEKRATTTESLIEAVRALATGSKTGKVTIIAHSNGGLVAKYLVKVLSDLGKADIIDKVISVAVPYLGTPQAIGGLLHGADQSIAFGLIVKESIARGLGINMPSAYSLLPSREYFRRVSGSTISFASTTVADINDGSFPMNIADFAGQSAFIAHTQGNSALLGLADALHSIIDPFSWPATIAKWAIVGWNKSTASGIAYSESNKCLGSLVGLACSVHPVHEKVLTSMGDGTVVVPSAAYDDGTVIALDLKNASRENVVFGVDHSSIFESSTTLGIIDAMIRHPENATNTVSFFPGVTIGQPSIVTPTSYLSVSTHSPVQLHVYDSLGNHTGPIAAATGTDIYTAYEAAIPGSDYSVTDEGDSYVYLPDDGKEYSISIQGTGVGEFELDMKRKRDSETIESVSYSMVPVTVLTSASTTIGSSLASSTLIIDEDGDGLTDSVAKPNKPFDPIAYLEMYKKTIASIAGNLARGKALIKRIDKLEDLIRVGKLKKAKNLMGRLNKSLGHIRFKKLTDKDKQTILDQFDIFIQQFE